MSRTLLLAAAIACVVIVLLAVGRVVSRSMSSGSVPPITSATGPPPSLRPTGASDAATIKPAAPTTVLSVPGTYEASAHLGGDRPVAMTSGAGSIWVLGERVEGGARVWRIDPSDARSTPWAELAAPGETIEFGASKLWVLYPTSDSISVLDAIQQDSVEEIEAGGLAGQPDGDSRFLPTALAVGDTGVWLGSSRGGVRQLDARSYQKLSTITFPPQSVLDVTTGLGYVWVARGADGVTRIDEATGRRADTAVGLVQVEGITTGFGSLWLSGVEIERTGEDSMLTGRGALVRLDPTTQKLDEPIVFPHSIGRPVASQGAVWVASGDAGLLWRVEPSGNRVESPAHSLLRDVSGIAGSPEGIWVGDAVTRRVNRIGPPG